MNETKQENRNSFHKEKRKKLLGFRQSGRREVHPFLKKFGPGSGNVINGFVMLIVTFEFDRNIGGEQISNVRLYIYLLTWISFVKVFQCNVL